MRAKAILVLVASILIFALGIQVGLTREKEEEEDIAKIMRKLDGILANQAEIFRQFDEIRQELSIIKIRVTA